MKLPADIIENIRNMSSKCTEETENFYDGYSSALDDVIDYLESVEDSDEEL